MHPLVRDLYKRVLIVGRDYSFGLNHVKTTWKRAIRNPQNCPSCFIINNQDNDAQAVPLSSILHDTTSNNNGNDVSLLHQKQRCNEEIMYAVQNGRNMVKEMMGIIQLKKYRTMNQRYGGDSGNTETQSMVMANSADKNPVCSANDVEQELQHAMKRLEQQQQQAER